MAEAKKNIRIDVGTSFDGRGLKAAGADIDALRKKMERPFEGPLNKFEQAVRNEQEGILRGLERRQKTAAIRDEARRQLFGGGPLRDISDRDDSTQRARDRRARDIRRQRDESALRETLEQQSRDRRARQLREQRRADALQRGVASEADRLSDRGGYGRGFVGARPTTATARREAELEKRLYRDLKAVGIFAAATRVAVALAKLPETLEKYREAVKAGESKFNALRVVIEETVPVFGPFSKAGRSIREAYFDNQFDEMARKEHEGGGIAVGSETQLREYMARKRERENINLREMEERRAALDGIRGKTMMESRDATRNSREEAALYGTTGTARERAQAQLDRVRAQRELDSELSKANKLSPDQQKEFRANIESRRADVERKYQETINEIQARAFAEREQALRDHRARMSDEESEAAQRDLQMAGMHNAARLRAIVDAYKKEQEAASKKLADDQQRARDEFGESWQGGPMQEAARERYEAEVSAARRRRDQSMRGAIQEGNEEALRLRISLLEQAGNLGDRAAEAESERLRFEQDRRDTLKQINDQLTAGLITQEKANDLSQRTVELEKKRNEEAEKRAKQTERERSLGVSHDLTSMREDELRKLAGRTGNARYNREADALAITREYESRAADLRRKLDDPNTTDEERKNIEAWLQALPQQMGDAIRDLTQSIVTKGDIVNSLFAPTQQVGAMTGIGASIREKYMAETSDEKREAQKTNKNLNDLVEQFKEFMRRWGNPPPPQLR